MVLQKTQILIPFTFLLFSCNWTVPESNEGLVDTLSVTDSLPAKTTSDITGKEVELRDTLVRPNELASSTEIDVKDVDPHKLVSFSETLVGTPYVYASTDPRVGFDCSGFITYVFNHFGIRVPRSSVDFTNVGTEIPVSQATRGDIILFSGTNPAERHVGHMGLVVSNSDTLRFIHATSGKAMGVTVTPLSSYYMARFVKAIRIFKQND
ncbi:MAG TPA: C40 family peptidase [Flavisolibacter sp.]